MKKWISTFTLTPIVWLLLWVPFGFSGDKEMVWKDENLTGNYAGGEDIRDILRLIGKKNNIRLKFLGEVKGTVRENFDENPSPLKEAFYTLLEQHDLASREQPDEGMIVVFPQSYETSVPDKSGAPLEEVTTDLTSVHHLTSTRISDREATIDRTFVRIGEEFPYGSGQKIIKIQSDRVHLRKGNSNFVIKFRKK